MSSLSLSLAMAAAAALAACSPHFDWRDYRPADAPYTVLFPAKPSTQVRAVNLGAHQAEMHMAAAEVDGVTFAVGSAALPDAAAAQAAIAVMKSTMVRNINGSVQAESQASSAAGGHRQSSIEVKASGMRGQQPVVMVGRFIAKDKRVYQAVAVGDAKKMSDVVTDTFMDSFKVN